MLGDRRRAAEEPIAVRPASEADLVPLTQLDLTYPAGKFLAITRTGTAPEHTFTLHWRYRDAPNRLYSEYTPEFLARALERVELFLVAVRSSKPVGMIIGMVPAWTDATEITDLAVDFSARQTGAGRALINAAARWARDRGHRAIWVEPRTDNADAIAFYLRLGFRISGFNDRLYTNRDDRPGETTLFMHLPLR
jgi:ribosomal protein S18 acetylase RimI-like enzyme